MTRVVLGVDASSTTIGYTILEVRDKIVSILDISYISLDMYEDLVDKAKFAEEKLKELYNKYSFNEIYIEEDLQKFKSGSSSSHVIRKLSRFNGMITYILYHLTGHKPTHLDVNYARKLVGCKVIKTKPSTTKNQVLEWVKRNFYQNKLVISWPTKLITRGKFKGQTVEIKECFDMADSYVIAYASNFIER